MPQYKYSAINQKEEKITGFFLAKDENELAVELSKQGLYLISAAPYTGKTPSSFFTLGTGKVSHAELTTFCRQYSIMINSGISLLGGLEVLKNQKFSSYFRSLLQVIYEDVKAGMMLSDAMSKHKGVFPAFFRSMIKVGETSGKLDIVMNSLADYYEKDAALKRKTKGAFAYPLMLLFMTIGIVALMLAYVIPTFREALSSLDVEITGLTKTVYDISDFILEYGLYILALSVVIFLLLFLYGKTAGGRRLYDTLKITIPGLKKVNVEMITARFARGFGLLLSSGMDITEAMDVVRIVFGNKEVEHRFTAAAEDVRHGVPLAIAFDRRNIFPPIMVQMIAVGEKTASLDEILMRSCGFYDESVESEMTALVNKIQPIMLLLMGGIIGTLFIAVYSPMIAIMQGL